MELAHASPLRVPFGFTEEVTRRAYLRWGAVLFVLRYAVEAALVARLTGRVLDPVTFVIPYFARPAALMAGAEPLLLLSALPFLWVAVSMSVRRAAAAGKRESLGFLVLVPGFHYVAMAALAALPDRPGPSAAKPTGPFREAWGAVREAVEPAVNAPQLRAAMVFALVCTLSVFAVWPPDHDPVRWRLLFCPAAAAGIATWIYRRPMTKPVEPIERVPATRVAATPAPTKQRPEVSLPARGARVGCLLSVLLLAWMTLSFGWEAAVGWLLFVCPFFAAIGAAACSGEGTVLNWTLALSVLATVTAFVTASWPLALVSAVVFLAALMGVVIRALVIPWDGKT